MVPLENFRFFQPKLNVLKQFKSEGDRNSETLQNRVGDSKRACWMSDSLTAHGCSIDGVISPLMTRTFWYVSSFLYSNM